MLEILIVLVLVGILAGLASLGWSAIQWKLQAKGGAEELRNALMLARNDAMTRQRHSGVLLDPARNRYLRFVDSSAVGAPDGRYSTGEKILQEWSKLPSHFVVFDTRSSMAPDPVPRYCESPAGTTPPTRQTGTYSVVFRPDGSSWATLQMKMGVTTSPVDTFRLGVLPAAGLVMLER
ncbi:MAG: GspH/FimT family pseudopilin [Fibrobacteria bacterium]|nr:GspH/FimT family pseudopilin [Fibrobacteria bacterium]